MTKEETDAIRERRKGLSIASVSAGPAVALLLDAAGADIDALLAETGQPRNAPEIAAKDVEFREFNRLEADTFCVIATVRYANGVTIHREAIQDYGNGLLELAKSQALAELQANPRAVPLGNYVEMRNIEIPKTWTRT